MSKEELRERISAALTEVTTAESALEKALRAIGNAEPRAQKVAVTEVVSDAFARLRRAHEALEVLRDVIDRE